MEIQAVVNELARKLAEDPSSVRLSDFLTPAVTAVLDRRMAMLADEPRSDITCKPSPETGISAVNGFQLLLSVLAMARGLAEQIEGQLHSDREREPEAA